jgi:hypothetical protein
MIPNRRELLKSLLLAVPAAHAAVFETLGIPGPWRGRVIAVEHPGSIVNNVYQADAIAQVMEKGMTQLTGAPDWTSAWRTLFEKGDVVGIKVSPVGGTLLGSDATVVRRICDGLKQAGVAARDIVLFSRYRQEVERVGYAKWLPEGARWQAPSERYTEFQMDMDGYDRDVYAELSLVAPNNDPNDSHFRRSYVNRLVTTDVNKIVNLPVLKHHQSAGVTNCLKNLSHGCVNNVFRSHSTNTLNACGIFIPSIVSLPVFRRKVVLNIVDAVKSAFHGGPGARPQFIWEHKTMYFGTDPVALDKVGWKVLDARRKEAGLPPIATQKPDQASTYLNCQVEHIEIAGSLKLGAFDDSEIDVKRFKLG